MRVMTMMMLTYILNIVKDKKLKIFYTLWNVKIYHIVIKNINIYDFYLY